jgi:hypothetical protein
MEIIASSPVGIGSRAIRNALKRIIDVDENGSEVRLFAAVGNMHLSRVVAIARDEDGDLLLITDHAQTVMEQLGSWDEFLQD